MIFFRDRIDVQKISRNTTFGDQTEGKVISSKALIQDNNRIAYTENGKTLLSNMLIFVPKSLNINRGDRVKITKKALRYFNDDKEWEVKYVKLIGGFSIHHKEVII